MNYLVGPWNEIRTLIYVYCYFFFFLKKYFSYSLIKKYSMIFCINILYYYTLFIILKFNLIMKYNSLLDIICVDYPGRIINNKRFELIYVFLYERVNLRCFFKVLLNKENLIISLKNLYNSSVWLEREIWDLFGLKFIINGDLRRLLTDYGFNGHPLLKNFPLMGFFELRYEDTIKCIVEEFIEIMQSYRSFIFENPWVAWNL